MSGLSRNGTGIKGLSRQRGLGMLSWIAILGVVSILATFLVRLGPVYMDSWTVKSVLSSVTSEPEIGSKTPGEIRSSIDSRFTTNRVDVIRARDIKITTDRGVTVVDASYEVRVPLIFNIDAVVRFDDLIYEIPRR